MLAMFFQLEIQLSPDIIANVLSVLSPNKLIQLLSIFLFSRFQIHSPYCMHCRHAVWSPIVKQRGAWCLLCGTVNGPWSCSKHGFDGGITNEEWWEITTNREKLINECFASRTHKSWCMVEPWVCVKDGRIITTSCRLLSGCMRAQAIITCTGFRVTYLGILNMNMMIVLSIKLEMEDERGLYELCISHCVLVMPSMSLLLFKMYIDLELRASYWNEETFSTWKKQNWWDGLGHLIYVNLCKSIYAVNN